MEIRRKRNPAHEEISTWIFVSSLDVEQVLARGFEFARKLLTKQWMAHTQTWPERSAFISVLTSLHEFARLSPSNN